jgi:hypothetical protein
MITAMANNTKSTSKKTTKSAAAAKGSKTTKTKKAAAKAPAKATAAKSNGKRVLSPTELLRSMHISLALAYGVFAVIVIGFVTTVAVPVTLGIQARDGFASRDFVVLGAAQEVFYNVQPKYVLAAALLVSAIGSLLLATKLRTRYESTIKSRVSGMRWILFGLSGALTIKFVALLAGVQDLSLLKLSAGLVFGAAMLSWIAERDNAGASRPKWLAYVLGLGAGALAWFPVLVSLIGTSVYGMERFGWHVYTIALAALLGFTGFAVILYKSIKAGRGGREYTAIESTYLRIDLFTKFVIVLVTILALD